MSEDDETEGDLTPKIPKSKRGKTRRAVLNTLGAVPFAGGLFSAMAGYWGEQEEAKANEFLRNWISMIQDEIKEKEKTIIKIMSRVDMHDKAIQERITSDGFQSLLKKSFRELPAAESEEKRVLLRNLLSNAAASQVSSDDVVRLFLDWLNTYSPFHFEVMAAVYNSQGISRGQIWEKVGRERVPKTWLMQIYSNC